MAARGDEPQLLVPATTSRHADPAVIWQKVLQASVTSRAHPELTVAITTDRPVGIVFTSDWHIGNAGTDHTALVQDIDKICRTPGLFAFVGGDPVDNLIATKLLAAGRDEQIISPSEQWVLYRDLIARLRPKLVAVGRGNHDGWTQSLAGIDGIGAALGDIPVLHTGEDVYLLVQVGQQVYTIYRKHRPISASRTNRTLGARRAYDWGDRLFDIGVTEHHHEASIACELRHGHYRWFVTTGSYKIHDAYARERGYAGGQAIMPVAILWPNRRNIVVELGLENAIERLSCWYDVV